MIRTVLDQHGASMRQTYEALVLAMGGALSVFETSVGLGGPAMTMLYRQVSRLHDVFVPQLEHKSWAAVRAAAEQGTLDAGKSPEGAEQAAPDALWAWVASAVAADQRTVMRGARDAQLRLVIAGGGTGYAQRQLALQKLPSQQADRFVQLDRMQRRRSSTSAVAAHVQMHMVESYCDAFLDALGERTFAAVHAEGERVELSLDGNWPEWQAEHMHPNTRWQLQPLRKEAP